MGSRWATSEDPGESKKTRKPDYFTMIAGQDLNLRPSGYEWRYRRFSVYLPAPITALLAAITALFQRTLNVGVGPFWPVRWSRVGRLWEREHGS